MKCFLALLLLSSTVMCSEETSLSQGDSSNIDSIKDKQRKKLLDTAKNGVVIIKTNAYAEAEDAKSDSAWSGTGFIVDKKRGIVVTNSHITGGSSVCTYNVKFSDGTTTQAKLLYDDPVLDFSFIEIDPQKFPKETTALELSSEDPEVNQTIFCMGNSAGDEFSTYKGTIFNIYTNVGPFPAQSFSFSGMTVGGASGSPVFMVKDNKPMVIGIIYGGKFVSGAALPIRYVRTALKSLLENKNPERRSVGIMPTLEDIDELVKANLLTKENADVYRSTFPEARNQILFINTRVVGSPSAEKMIPGDVLWEIWTGEKYQLLGPQIRLMDEIVNRSEKEIKLRVYRDGKLVDVSIPTYPLNHLPNKRFIGFAGTTFFGNSELLKIQVGDPDAEGVYIQSSSSTSPFRKISSGGWWSSRIIKILEVNGKETKNLDDLKKVISGLKEAEVFTVKYIDFMGERMFGDTISGDRQPRFSVLRYDGRKYDSPKEFKFDTDKREWKMDLIWGTKGPIA